MGKASAPSAPDYSAQIASSTEAAQIAAQTSKDQLDWAKQQYADQKPQTDAYMTAMTSQMTEQNANAVKDRSRYESMYQPVEDQFVRDVNNYATPQRATERAGAAMADVSTAFDAARTNALSNLESFGIDPSQTRYGALDLGTRISQAAATAAAGTGSRLQTEATGMALKGEAINIGKGYPGQVAQSYAGATSAGGAGINAGINTSTAYGNLMGTPTQWAGLVPANNQAASGALNMGYNNAQAGANMNAGQAGQANSAIGALVGAAMTAAAAY